MLVGAKAVEQQEKNPTRTLYDAKRFIGRTISENDVQFEVWVVVSFASLSKMNYVHKIAKSDDCGNLMDVAIPLFYDFQSHTVGSLEELGIL